MRGCNGFIGNLPPGGGPGVGTDIISENYFDVSKTGGSQSLPSGALTQIDSLAENYDPGNNFASNTYTTPTNGIYIFDLWFEVNMGIAAGIWELSITTGSSPLTTQGGYALAGGNLWLHVSTGAIYRTATQLIRAYAYQNTGQPCSILAGGKFIGSQLFAGTIQGAG